MRRPVGVILTCILLGVAALLLLFNAAVSLLSILLMGHLPTTAAGPTPMPGMGAFFVFIAFFYVALAAWAIATIVGLAKMRSWARYSAIVIGAGVTLVSVFGAIGMIAARAMAGSVPMPPGQNPEVVRVVMVFIALFCLAIAAVGVWWVVYFSLRSTREAFALASGPRAIPVPGYIPPPSPYDPSSYAVASYIPIPDPNAQPVAPPVLMLDEAVAAASAPPRRPIAVTIIAWLFIVGAAITLPSSFLPFPTFMMGVAISGWPAHLTLLSFAVIAMLTGIGLLRLEKIALYTAYAMYLLGIVNSSLFLFPSVRDRMFAYQMEMIQKFSMGMPQPFPFDNHMMALMMIPGVVVSVTVCIVLVILLFINRAAFDHQTDVRQN